MHFEFSSDTEPEYQKIVYTGGAKLNDQDNANCLSNKMSLHY
jgi:hypothetical protein